MAMDDVSCQSHHQSPSFRMVALSMAGIQSKFPGVVFASLHSQWEDALPSLQSKSVLGPWQISVRPAVSVTTLNSLRCRDDVFPDCAFLFPTASLPPPGLSL